MRKLITTLSGLMLIALIACNQTAKDPKSTDTSVKDSKESGPAKEGTRKSAGGGGGTSQRNVLLTVDGVIISMSSKDLAYSYTGSLNANEQIDVRPEISAKVTKVLFKEGNKVNKGQLLVKMFDADLQAQLKKNKLQVELKNKEVDRKRELLKLNGISKEEFETSENGLLTLIAEQDLLLAQISKTELIAPFSGIAGLRNVSEGSFVTNSTIITSLQQLDPIKVEFSIPEKYKPYIVDNMEIKFTVEGSDRVYSAKIYALESKIDAGTRSIRIRALAPNTDRSLFPGAFVSIKLNLFPGKETIFITARAIIPILNGEQVFLVKNGKVAAAKVITGIRTETEVEILDGLAVNDTLIVSGLLQVKEGMPVRARLTRSSNKTNIKQ